MAHDLIIIGSGPAGYVAAIRAGQLGMKTLVIDEGPVGGMCVNWGCVPARQLLRIATMYHQARSATAHGIRGGDKLEFDWKTAMGSVHEYVNRTKSSIAGLLEKHGVEFLSARATVTGQNTVSADNRVFEATHMLVCTGSRPAPSRIVDKRAVEIDALFTLDRVTGPIAVFGNGPVALELAQIMRNLGFDVTLLLPGAWVLPGFDAFIDDYVRTVLEEEGIDVLVNVVPEGFTGNRLKIGNESLECGLLINAAPRVPVLPPSDIFFEQEGSYLQVDNKLETSVPGIYAAGDVTGTFLARTASAQGLAAVNAMAGIRGEGVWKKEPFILYTEPEVAVLGKTEKELEEEGIKFRVRVFPLSTNGHALLAGETEGFVRVLYEETLGEVLGVQIGGRNASDLIQEAAALMEIEPTLYDLSKIAHAHPTVSEVFMELSYDAK